MGGMPQPDDLPARALDTSAEHPWPVRVLSLKISDYVDRMSPVWVEGQVVQLNQRGATAYLTVRDPEVDMSLSVTIASRALAALPGPLTPGARVVVQAKPTFWTRRGVLQLEARQIRPVGVGDLLARLEVLRRRLADEGLFDASRKKPLPVLPRGVGLVTGRGSAAEHDVVVTATSRWPAVRFVHKPVAVQGSSAVSQVCAALAELDRDRTVDVVVIARGGGAVEELLAFSNETLLRAVAAMATPVVSAIGHESDTPLLDYVADVRASTPTDAGRRIVVDAALEREHLAAAVGRIDTAVRRRVELERQHLGQLRARPVMRDRHAVLTAQQDLVATLRVRSARRVSEMLERRRIDVGHLRGQVRALAPVAVLERGYALVQRSDGSVVTDPQLLADGEQLSVRVALGEFAARVERATGR